MVDDALGVALLGLRALEVLGAQLGERQLAVVEALHGVQREREQGELATGGISS